MRRLADLNAGAGRIVLGALALGLLAGCDTFGGRGAEDAEPAGTRSSVFGSLFATSSTRQQETGGRAGTAVALANPNTPCPPIDVRSGTAAWRVFEKGKENDPMALRYQAALGETARECSGLGAELAMRVGVVGRVLVGPRGGPGRVEVPLRIAVVDADDKPVFSKLHRIPVELRAGDSETSFTYVEEGVMVPLQEPGLSGWRVLVGFDPSPEAPVKGRKS